VDSGNATAGNKKEGSGSNAPGVGSHVGLESPTYSLERRASSIEILVLDMDGVLTDGGIIYGNGPGGMEDWLEVKKFHVRDGSGLKLWHLAGKRSAIITGRRSGLVELRASELGIGTVIQGAADKTPAFHQVLRDNGLSPEVACYIGDDVPDLGALALAGLAVAVADACVEVRAQAHHVTRQPGGHGAVREVIELILRCQGVWTRLIDQYLQKG
jgi:YrbI family 3-deoxy-D-manno-octulosonate 8-phosphate phosphatase